MIHISSLLKIYQTIGKISEIKEIPNFKYVSWYDFMQTFIKKCRKIDRAKIAEKKYLRRKQGVGGSRGALPYIYIYIYFFFFFLCGGRLFPPGNPAAGRTSLR